MQEKKRLMITNESKESKAWYIFEHLFYGGLAVLYTNLFIPFFTPIAAYEHSFPILVLCVTLTCVVGIMITNRYNRTAKGALTDAIIGLATVIGILLIFRFTNQR